MESRAVKFIRAVLSPGTRDPGYRPKKANLQRPVKTSVEEPKDGPPRAATASPHSENAVEGSQPIANAKIGLNISEKAAEEVPEHHPEPTVGAPDQTKSTAEDELLGRAIGMIRSALEKGAE